MLPIGTSPISIPRVPVRVRTGERTFQIGDGMTAAFPVTIRTAMVSPTALPIPRMMAAVIPDRAAGVTTLLMVCQCVAPRANDASRYSRGAEEIASSETLMIVGSAITPRRMDPASQVSPLGTAKFTRIQSVRTIRPKNPNTTEGIPARRLDCRFQDGLYP